jgi:hypothetical protein
MSNHIDESNRPFVVCPVCAGHGTHGPGWVFTSDELDEQFGADADEFCADMREGRYDVLCDECGGKRVVRAECECADCEREREEIADMLAMERAERAFGC